MLDRKDGMVSVDDGVRRLRLLEAKGKVWTQELVLQVEEKSVSLLDPDTKVACTCRCTGSRTLQVQLQADPSSVLAPPGTGGEVPGGQRAPVPGPDGLLRLPLPPGSGLQGPGSEQTRPAPLPV